MKTLFKIVFVLALMLGVSGLLMAQTKSGDRSKKTTGANSATPQASADKKPAAEGEKATSTSWARPATSNAAMLSAAATPSVATRPGRKTGVPSGRLGTPAVVPTPRTAQ